MAHLTDTPYINSSNVLLLLNDLAVDLQAKGRVNDVVVDVLVVGGSALALKYAFRSTVDIDADIRFSGNVTESINSVASMRGIPRDWINQDFMKSYSYSRNLWTNAIYVTTLQGYLRVFVVNDLDQLCMKVTAGRDKDFTDMYKLLEILISQGCTYSMFLQEFEYLYKGTVRPKKRALNVVRMEFKRHKLL